MPKRMYTEEYIQDIADAIREKKRVTDVYKVSEMGPAVRSLPSGLDGIKLTVIETTYTTE